MSTLVAIIEDNNMMRYLLKSYLETHYLRVVDFNNGLEFYAWLEQNNVPDIVVTDLEMPEMDGFELVSTLKNSQLYKNIRVIILSGLENFEARIKYQKLGVDDCLTKPFNPKELLLKIYKATLNKNHANTNLTLRQPK